MPVLSSLPSRALNGTGVAAEFRRRRLASTLTFVGGTAYSSGESNSELHTVSLTGLTGGIASQPAAGDLIIAAISFRGSADQDISASGYTEIYDLAEVNTNYCQLGVFQKTAGASESSIVFDTGTSTQRATAVIQVWRNQNANYLDAGPFKKQGNPGQISVSNITTLTNNAVVVVIGACSGNENTPITNLTVPSGMTNFFTENISVRTAIGIASVLVPTAGTYFPSNFGGGNASVQNSFIAATLAIRPL